MKKFDLLKNEDSIIRILDIKDDEILIIDCIRKSMPVWIERKVVDEYTSCNFNELDNIPSVDTLNNDQKKIMYERFTLIASILPFISDEKVRSYHIRLAAIENGISKQTVRNYLCNYLTYMDIAALAPYEHKKKKALTADEKNMRWALNKYFYTTQKQSLNTAYTMMLKNRYCDDMGVLYKNYPSFYQFRYFYRKTKNMQNFYISRNGLKSYQRNNRPLIGEGVQEFAPNIGVGMLDATVCDIYLVNDVGDLIGRPLLTACIDAYSSLCCGYALSWEGGMHSLRKLMMNITADKTEHCKRFGISIDRDNWECNKLPATFVTDMGSEYKSENFEQITELGIKVINLPSYRPELKGTVEKFFDMIQSNYKKHLKGKGIIEPDYMERGAHDYRKDACLTMSDFEKIVLYCIIYYNSQRIIENFPYTDDMIKAGVKPFACDIWNWGKIQIGANLVEISKRDLILVLMPRTTGKFSRYGLKVNKMRYHCEGFTERYLKGGSADIAYDPDDVSLVWLIENGIYTEFRIIESQFQGLDLTAAIELQNTRKTIVKDEKYNNLQAQIELAQHIETIARNVSNSDVNLKNIRDTRRKEQNNSRCSNMKGIENE